MLPAIRARHAQQTFAEPIVTDWSVVGLMAAIAVVGLAGMVGGFAWYGVTTAQRRPPAPAPVVGAALPRTKPRLMPHSQLVTAPVEPKIERLPQPVVALQTIAPGPRRTSPAVKKATTVIARRQTEKPVVRVDAQTQAPSPPSEDPFAFVRRSQLSEEELCYALAKFAREVNLDSERGTAKKIWEESRKQVSQPKRTLGSKESRLFSPLQSLLANRVDLHGLPIRFEADCQASKEVATNLSEYSRLLRTEMRRLENRNPREPTSPYRQVEEIEYGFHRLHSERPDGIATLLQVLQAEDEPLRMLMLRLLAGIPGPEATAALARRALFDLSAAMRETAVAMLKDRRPEDYQPVFLEGLRYPWAPVADHAAEALVALHDRRALPQLLEILARPDPAAPRRDKDGQWIVPEIVRINYLRNCLLCHAVSLDRADPVRGLVPTPGQPLPEVYYDSYEGDFVRADITYLRQDFSLKQLVKDAKPWPALQRFDYVVRQRPLTPAEVKQRGLHDGSGEQGAPADYPQRGAVLYAIKGLAGQEVSSLAERWKRLVPPVMRTGSLGHRGTPESAWGCLAMP
jgi:hypothetical protein